MSQAANNAPASSAPLLMREQEFVMERIFNAPRELVFQMWSDPQHLAHWWGPTGWTMPVCEVDFRPGGTWRYCFRGPDASWPDAWVRATYREIVVPARIVYANLFVDADGNTLPEMPEIVSIFDFIEMTDSRGPKTKLVNTQQFASAATLQQALEMQMVEGQTDSFGRLDTYLRQAQTNP